ncbi:uncharacterized protein LOC115681825 [Syzygium oleosum]|uniref:uncharacterized protein LOC115681825 n=1 Tax=Syzygium oleosum TaxID=219896 RepID=UPI0011D20E85|nr:uncharacterized protein LOC115681825 [Syzygium oleosum]
MTDHHYLSDRSTPSRRALGRSRGSSGTDGTWKDWFVSDVDTIQDALWHKACHPVNISKKQVLAMDPDVATMVRASGAGSAAARLPAMELEMRAPCSYRTLLQTVRPMFELVGGSLTLDLLNSAIEAVGLFPPGDAPRRTGGGDLPQGVLAWMNNRHKAVQFLGSVLERNTDHFAYCYGFYVAMSDQAMTFGAESGKDTLKNRFSLNRLKGKSFAAYLSGLEAYGDYAAILRRKRMAGEVDVPQIINS